MNELFARQAAVLRRLVSGYRGGSVGLDSLVQNIEGIGDVLGIEAWKDAVFPVVLLMEQVNAGALNANRNLTEGDKASVEGALRELEALIVRFEAA